MQLLKYNLVLRLFAYSVAVVYGWLYVLGTGFAWLKHPTKKFWRVKRRTITPDCLTDPARGDHCYAQLKDVKLHYVEKGDKKNPLMLFVHGFPEFWYSWRNQMDEFAKDHWVVAFDMRGYGDSEKPEGIDNYALKHLVNDIKELAQHLGREKFTLVAHDWGGAVGWAFVEEHPEMLERYVLMDAPRIVEWKKLVLTDLGQFLMSWYVFFYQLPYLPEFALRSNDLGLFKKIFRGATPKEKSEFTDEDIDAYKYTFGKPGALTAPINYYRANIFRYQKMINDSSRKLDVGVPGLFILGEEDKYISFKFIKMFEENISDMTVKIVKGGNHFVQQDAPKTVNKLIREFLKTK